MGKRRNVANKRGRPRKTIKLEKDIELTSNSVDGVDRDSNAYSSPGTASESLDELMVSRPLTRSALASANKKAALDTPSRTPLQNNDGNPSEASTLLLVKQILFESNKVDQANHIPVEALPSKPPVQAKDAHFPDESIYFDKTVEAQNDMTSSSNIELPRENVLDLKKFTWDLLAQTQQPELPFQVASPCSDETLVNNNLPEREANVVSNIFANGPEDTANGTAQISENPTTTPTQSLPSSTLMVNKSSQNNEIMSEPGARDNFINVQGYKMKKEMAPLLKAIFNKYGDIAKESTFTMESRSCLLELVCSIYKRLEASKFTQLTTLELESMFGQIGDLEIVKVNVGWLHRRLDQISKAQRMCDDGSTLEDVKARSLLVISEKQKSVQICVEEFEACMAAALKLQEKVQQEKDELSAAQSFTDEINNFFDGSLVHGLV
ncbi:hypothetical protein C2S51_002061 [Perilla frutescens var. frutescens]|nr:hypothetical protein C2S51_002061 [Perilla frutescens var. frutescens]